MRFDPFRELDRLTQQMWGGSRASLMPMDAYRHGDQFVAHFDLPGVDPASIEVTVEQNVLCVRAERSWGKAEGDEILVSERPQGCFSRQLFLGEGLDTEHIQASYDNGVLTVRVPVAEAARARRVEITSSNGAAPAIEAQSAAA
jgi:HSP20 family protein